jgi:uncharacterized protein (TIGR03085 family)
MPHPALGRETFADDASVSDLATSIELERRAMADTVEAVGADAPTLCGTWTAADVAAHVVSLDRGRGLTTFVGRLLVSRYTLRLNLPALRFPAVADASIRRARRRGVSWTVARLREPPPPLLARPSVAVVGLFEVWVHHQDVARANGGAPVTAPDLSAVMPWLLRYQRREVNGVRLTVVADDGQRWAAAGAVSSTAPQVTVSGAVPELVLWLAGRRGHAAVVVTGDAAAVARLDDRRGRI